ncbi:MAG TPA: AraC family transcriptional regulator [Thermoanaerobaculia bacterium]
MSQDILFANSLLSIGRFKVASGDPAFRRPALPAGETFVFSRTSAWIWPDGRRRFVADPNVVTFHNRNEAYRRDELSVEGHHGEWFTIERGTLVAALGAYEPGVVDDPERPFRFSHGPSDPCSYLLQRMVVRHATESKPVDALYLEERVLQILARVVDNAFRVRGIHPSKPRRDKDVRHSEIIEEAKSVLAEGFREPLSLAQIAARTGTSVFHLCRLFRRGTGDSLQVYRNQLRLRTALEQIADPSVDLTDLALDLGYSTHSHFTAAFRQAFGITPSSLRRTASPGRLRELAHSLILSERRRPVSREEELLAVRFAPATSLYGA